MGFVHDHSTDRSDLMLLDATTLDTIATVHLPVPVYRAKTRHKGGDLVFPWFV